MHAVITAIRGISQRVELARQRALVEADALENDAAARYLDAGVEKQS